MKASRTCSFAKQAAKTYLVLWLAVSIQTALFALVVCGVVILHREHFVRCSQTRHQAALVPLETPTQK